MALLRFASILTLAFWVGGLAALALVGAPTLFDVLEASDPAAGRTLAAQIFGAMFDRFQHVAWICGGLLTGLLILRAVLGPRPRPFAVRLSMTLAMLAFTLTGGLVVAPRIEAIRRDNAGTVASLADDDARKIAFGRLHGVSTGLAGLTLVAGIGLLWMEMKDPH